MGNSLRVIDGLRVLVEPSAGAEAPLRHPIRYALAFLDSSPVCEHFRFGSVGIGRTYCRSARLRLRRLPQASTRMTRSPIEPIERDAADNPGPSRPRCLLAESLEAVVSTKALVVALGPPGWPVPFRPKDRFPP